jgi:hypothetical protein
MELHHSLKLFLTDTHLQSSNKKSQNRIIFKYRLFTAGQSIDYYNQGLSLWQPAQIDSIRSKDNFQIALIKIENSDLVFEEIVPSYKVTPCGTHLQ